MIRNIGALLVKGVPPRDIFHAAHGEVRLAHKRQGTARATSGIWDQSAHRVADFDAGAI